MSMDLSETLNSSHLIKKAQQSTLSQETEALPFHPHDLLPWHYLKHPSSVLDEAVTDRTILQYVVRITGRVSLS